MVVDFLLLHFSYFLFSHNICHNEWYVHTYTTKVRDNYNGCIVYG